ncbi:MAG: hypothetical protein KIT84_42775, partial [Labilithrix sp.]|nr:hypothetical protein [Labilithrix sp.]
MIAGDRRASRIVEAAYRWAPTDEAWLSGIADAASALDVGGGVAAYIVALRGKPCLTARAVSGAAASDVDAIAALTSSFSPRLARAIYEPTEFAGNAAHRLERLVAAFGTTRTEVEDRAGCALPAMWALIGGDPRRRAVNVAVFGAGRVTATDPYPKRRIARRLGLVAAHLGAALRLRDTLAPPATTTRRRAAAAAAAALM